jgi:hypothetical protein
MPTPLSAYTLAHQPFPTRMPEPAAGEGRPAFTLFESFAKEETVVLVEAHPVWEYVEAGEPTDAVFEVVAAYTQDQVTADPATAVVSVPVSHGTERRFLMGIPGGHTPVVYPADPERGSHIVSAAPDSYLKVTVVDYWA